MNEMIIFSAIIAALCMVIGLQVFLHWKERKDLYDRIMSRDLTDYKKVSEPPKAVPSSLKKVMERWRDPNGGIK